LGNLGLEAAFKVFAGYYEFYYVDMLGLAISLAAIINVIYALWDAVNDPLVGYLSDNTRTRWGRRKPWLLTALPFYAVFLVLIYAVPDVFKGGNLLFWYALVVIFLFETVNTIVSTNYEALFPELFQQFKERTRASAYNQGFGMVGELVGFALTPIIYSQFGFVPTAVFFAVMAGILVFSSLLRNREDPIAQKAPPLDLKDAFGDVLRDRPFWQFTIVATLLWFSTGVYTLGIPFWTKYTLQASPQAPSIIFAAVFLVAIASVSIWSRLVRRWGTKQTWLWAIGIFILSAIVLAFASNLVVGVIGAALAGVGLGGKQVCREMILANLVDQSKKRTGRRQEGVYYGLNRFIGRLSKILESLALILLGVMFGYVSGEQPGPDPGNAFRFLIGVFPLVCLIIAWVLARRLRFEEERPL
jgi:GPH family glycoside/pentoside/hexuronide:cation symporter